CVNGSTHTAATMVTAVTGRRRPAGLAETDARMEPGMSWLFLIGVSCDGVGAFLIAWPILRPASAEREAARPRWGGDHWAGFVRDRERRLVQYGALFLVAGFAFQAAGYITRLHHDFAMALVVLVAVVSGGLALGTWLAR